MRVPDSLIEKRLTALEAMFGRSMKRQEELKKTNIQDHIAACYYKIDQDIRLGSHEFYNLPGGRGSGKSSFVSLELVDGIMKDLTRQSNALVVRKYAVTLRGSVFSQIQWAIQTLGVADRWKSTVSPMQFTYETGQVIRLTGLDDPQKLKSLKPNRGYFKYLWIEEFSEINGEPEMRNLQQSVLRGGDQFTVFRSFNPPMSKSNWANAFIAVPDDRSLTFLTDYRQMPVEWLGQQFFDEAERLREVNPLAYRNEYLGEAVGSGGTVFPNVEVRTITDDEIAQQSYLFVGLDWGFATDPACVLKVAYDRMREEIRIIDEIYQRGLSNRQLADQIKAKGMTLNQNKKVQTTYYCEVYTVNDQLRIIADCAEPKSIADMRRQDLKVIACHKEPGCVEYRVKWLQHRKIIVDPKRTPNAHRELTTYEYEQDKTGAFLPSLPDKNNHSIDALAYALDRPIYTSKNSA